MTEQDRLDQVFRDRTTVHGDEWFPGTVRCALNAAGNNFLTHTTFAQDQDGNIRTRGAFGQTHDLAHRRRGRDHVVKAHAAFGFAREALHFP